MLIITALFRYHTKSMIYSVLWNQFVSHRKSEPILFSSTKIHPDDDTEIKSYTMYLYKVKDFMCIVLSKCNFTNL